MENLLIQSDPIENLHNPLYPHEKNKHYGFLVVVRAKVKVCKNFYNNVLESMTFLKILETHA